MNEIVIDLEAFPREEQEALRDRAVREGKPMKQLLAELISESNRVLLAAAGQEVSK